MLILDTHVLLWMDGDDASLGIAARRRIDAALASDQLRAVAISFWEVAMLCDKRRINLTVPLGRWRRELLAAGLGELPVDGRVGIAATELRDFHADPADRMIVAAAQLHGAQLLTADRRILAWQGSLAALDARN